MSSRFSRKKGPQGLPPVCRKPPEPLCDVPDVPEFLQAQIYIDDGSGPENFIHINETHQVVRNPALPTRWETWIHRPAWDLFFYLDYESTLNRVRTSIIVIYPGPVFIIAFQDWLDYPGLIPFDTLEISIPVQTLAARASARVTL